TVQNWAGSSPLPENVSLAPDPTPQPGTADRGTQATCQLPAVGDRFAGFEVVAVLGRGTFGRVYLARQGDLADRYVALKVSTDLAGESRTLARLQHTNIVPIYSVHRVYPFQAVCMPYCGATTLGHLLARYRGNSGLPATGRQLVDTLRVLNDETDVAPPLPPTTGSVPGLPPGGPAPAPEPAAAGILPDRPGVGAFLGLLRGMTYTDAVCWLGGRLADGLHYAHTYGVVHNDLKPANVLLTDDGQPMLLDFGVADDFTQRDTAAGGSIGGTYPYMSPEHLESTRTRTPVTDPRSDVYALGIILFEMLTGRHPFRFPTADPDTEVPAMIVDRMAGPPAIRPFNPTVSPGLEAIVRKCLAPDPARRYQSAAELREDLDQHRAGLPLRYVRVPSVRERVRKWARRNPRLTSNITLAAVVAVTILGCTAAFQVRGSRITRLDAEAAARGLDGDLDAARYLLTARAPDPDAVGAGVERCEAALARYGLPGDAGWENRTEFRALAADDRQRVRERLTEACVLLGRGYALRAKPGDGEGDWLERAAVANSAAERVAGEQPPRAVWEQRADLLRRRGDAAGAEAAATRARVAPLKTGKDYQLSAAGALAAGRYGEARDLFTKAVELTPGDYAAFIALGTAYDRLGRYVDAAGCYATAIALAPEVPWGYYSRGLAYLRLRDYAKARADLDRAAELAPGQSDTYLNRALAAQGLRDFPAALRDLDRAAAAGAPEVRVGLMRARVLEMSGDKAGAGRELDRALKAEPADEVTWVARGVARVGADPAAALADFEAALKANPWSLQALQNKAHALSKLGRTAEAVRALDRVLELYPDYVAARAGRGVMHARAGDWAAARADADEALRRDGSPIVVYQVAGVYALMSAHDPAHKAKAMDLLTAALRAGFGYDQLDGDKDLDPIRAAPEFRRVADAATVIKVGGRLR
ncbi:MAG TPA: tetratricopeptide repeat protein, partial [Urbifossiella sp.]|nr:tetratricopeptide repeat protein [Urbifossiella sp.]